MSVPAFIDLTEVDQIAQLRQYLKTCTSDIDENPKGDMIDDVHDIINSSSKIWKDTDQKDIEGVVNSILSLLFMIPIDQVTTLVEPLCDQMLYGASQGKALLSLKLLHNLFHGYPIKAPFLYKVYCTWVEVGGLARSIHLVPSDLDKVTQWMEMWGAGADQQHKLLRLLYDAQVSSGKTDAAAKVMVSLLKGFTADNAASARDDALKCITQAMIDENTYLFDELLTLEPVKALRGERIYNLLTIFVNGSVKEYKDFYESNRDFIAEAGLRHESNLRKMQLLTLVDVIGSSREIPFADIMQSLGIPDDELEEFVIDAIQSKLIRARIDHINRKLIVSQACQRTFGAAQWQFLAKRLQQWRNDLNRVNDKLQSLQA